MATEIKSLDDFKKFFPEATQELISSAKKEAQTESEAQTEIKIFDAVRAERERIIGLAKHHVGGSSAEKLAEAAGILGDPPPVEKNTQRQQQEVLSFEDAVSACVRLYGYSVAQAISVCAKNLPDEHKSYVERSQTGNVKPLDGFAAIRSKDFESAVLDYRNQKKCTLGQAISAVANACPELHQDYIDRVKKGKARRLPTI